MLRDCIKNEKGYIPLQFIINVSTLTEMHLEKQQGLNKSSELPVIQASARAESTTKHSLCSIS